MYFQQLPYFCGWPFQNCSAHNTWLTPPFTACTHWLKNSGVGVLPGSYATFLQNELHSQQRVFLSEIRRKLLIVASFSVFHRSELSSISITRFTSALADSMDDDGIV